MEDKTKQDIPSIGQAHLATDVKIFKRAAKFTTLHQIVFMKPMILAIAAISLLQISACSQDNNKTKTKSSSEKHVGGSCEGCEAIYESPIPFGKLNAIDTLADFTEAGQKIQISGIVYESDGKTPAKDVVIYVYHTDQTGRYTPGPNAKGWEKRNGRIRGWMKTDKNGSYSFYTLRPMPYPNAKIAAHIHVVVKEPNKNEYYLDEYLFDDDSLLTEKERNMKFRGGNGILKLSGSKDMMQATRNIILGLNVPDYPDGK